MTVFGDKSCCGTVCRFKICRISNPAHQTVRISYNIRCFRKSLIFGQLANLILISNFYLRIELVIQCLNLGCTQFQTCFRLPSLNRHSVNRCISRGEEEHRISTGFFGLRDHIQLQHAMSFGKIV